MDKNEVKRTLENTIRKINEAQKEVYLTETSYDSVYASCCLSVAKKKIREALEHIQKITSYNEGGDEDGKLKRDLAEHR